MRKRPVTFLLTLVVLAFAAVLGFFYLQEGSFEGAGRRMDNILSGAGSEANRMADTALDRAESVARDVADGRDEPEAPN